MLWLTLWLLTAQVPEIPYLAQSLTLNETAADIAARFQTEPSRGRNSGLQVLSFDAAPSGVIGHSHNSGHDSCDSTPAWSFQFRGARLETVQLNLDRPVLVASALPGSTPIEVDLNSGGGPIRFAAWTLDSDRVLLATGVRPEDGTTQSLLLLRRSLLQTLYPRVADAVSGRKH